MKTKLLAQTCILNFLFFTSLYAQNPLVKQWDYRYGGTRNEFLFSLIQTTDGGFILGGYSDSDTSGDKSQTNCINWYNPDYWVVKLNSLGLMQWEKRFGGNGNDAFRAMQQTSDGGYILGGWSDSDSSCEKSQNKWDTVSYSSDFWVIKIDSLGNKQWDKDFGGLDGDILTCLQQTNDGGYILGGWIVSGQSGDITQPVWGGYDYWILKTDASGNKLWDKRFGGTDTDKLSNIKQTNDGGFILAGYSYSGMSGDKTQASQSPGVTDYWVVKTDALGNKLWDKTYGGNSDDMLNALELTADGGFVFGGESYSGISGDKTQPSNGSVDYWIIKTDSIGNKIWDKDFGGASFDELYAIVKTNDGGYLFSGDSYSPISGDKTQSNLGFEQGWVVRTDSIGNKLWDKTMLTTGHDENGNCIKTQDGCYVFANVCSGGIGGFKTQPNWDVTNVAYDYWIVKFCDTTETTSLVPLPAFNDDITVYPNPFSDELTVSIGQTIKGKTEIKIFNVFGQLVLSQLLMETNCKIKTNSFSKGVYFIQITNPTKQTIHKIMRD